MRQIRIGKTIWIQKTEGYVKNYRALRHKNQPRYRKLKLENIHPINIKRPNKFVDQMDIGNIDTDK